MAVDVLGVYLVDFKTNIGGELSGKHYAVVLSQQSSKDGTLLVAPLTSKKSGRKYRGGFTLDCSKYQAHPKYQKAFVKIRKIREIDKSRVFKRKIYELDWEDKKKLQESFYRVFKFL